MKTITIFLALFASALAFRTPRIDPNADWKIVNGEEAAEGQFPHAVSVRYAGSHNCGGSIISDQFILCAAHCVVGYSPSQLSVVMGTNSLSSGGQKYDVAATIPHSSYSPGRPGNDISLIKLSERIDFSKPNVGKIELQRDFISKEKLTLCGWGRTSYPGNIPDRLQYVTLNSITVEECQKSTSTNDQEICTIVEDGKGACHGDSGGSLMYEGRVCGIVSRGVPCAHDGRPDLYTRVSAYTDWIEATMRIN